MRGTAFDNARFFCAAPTLDQARRIYWQDLKALIPSFALAKQPSETMLTIKLVNDSEIVVLGMDKPERIEGSPWDGGVLDEYGNMKEKAWGENIRPALADRQGWCDLIGVPEGRNHYYELDQKAQADVAKFGDASEFGRFTWFSSGILPESEIEAARRDLHPKVFQQEYEGTFVDFSGVAIFDQEKFLINGLPVEFPPHCDSVFAVIDTAIKDGKEHDGTAVVFFARSSFAGIPLVVLDWDIISIEGALLEDWLPSVFQRLEHYAGVCGARIGSLGAYIEDKASGMVLLQQARRHGWPATEIESALTSVGKDGRALSVSGYAWKGDIKISALAYDKKVSFKDASRNHFMQQVFSFRIGDKDQSRADDLFDCLTYGISIALGNNEGY